MDLSTFIVAVFCLIDDRIEERALRARGPLPKLSDAEVLTIEIVGEFLGLDTDEAIFRYFRRHYGEWFPALGEVHRTTFARQAANLWKIKERLSAKSFFSSLPTTPRLPSAIRCPCQRACLPAPTAAVDSEVRRPSERTLCSSRPSTVSGCTLGSAGLGSSPWGHHPHLGGPGLQAHELSVLPEIVEGTSGLIVGDRTTTIRPKREKSWRQRA